MTVTHAALAIMIAGITGASSWKVESIQVMGPGDVINVSGYSFKFEGAETLPSPNYTATRRTSSVSRDGTPITALYPEKRV